MSATVILYDRLWLIGYIDRLDGQLRLAQSLENRLEWKLATASMELRADYRNVLQDVRELVRSLQVTEDTLRDYLDNVQSAAIQLQRQCEKIEL